MGKGIKKAIIGDIRFVVVVVIVGILFGLVFFYRFWLKRGRRQGRLGNRKLVSVKDIIHLIVCFRLLQIVRLRKSDRK